jgi:hypothetical protein
MKEQHAKQAVLLLYQLRQHEPGEAAVLGVHEIQRHLHGVELEAMLPRHVEHVQVDMGILVAGEADVPDLARLPRIAVSYFFRNFRVRRRG